MERLKTYRINTQLAPNLVRIGDIVNYEGPLLTLFSNVANSKLYLFDWAEGEKHVNRWLVYNVAPEMLYLFLKKRISHQALFKNNPEESYYYFDTDGSHSFNDFQLIETEIPKNYIPESDSFFEVEDCPSFSRIETLLMKLISTANLHNTYLPAIEGLGTSRGSFVAKKVVHAHIMYDLDMHLPIGRKGITWKPSHVSGTKYYRGMLEPFYKHIEYSPYDYGMVEVTKRAMSKPKRGGKPKNTTTKGKVSEIQSKHLWLFH